VKNAEKKRKKADEIGWPERKPLPAAFSLFKMLPTSAHLRHSVRHIRAYDARHRSRALIHAYIYGNSIASSPEDPATSHRSPTGHHRCLHIHHQEASPSERPSERRPATETQTPAADPWDTHFMGLALGQARLAASAGEVPVGAIVVGPDNTILAQAHNRTERDLDPTAHAEMLCIRHAAAAAGGWRLADATMYVTLEPCPMCAGALLQTRIRRVVYGARNVLLGADGSWIDMMQSNDRCPDHDELNEERNTASPVVVKHDGGSTTDERRRRPVGPHAFHPRLVVDSGVLEEECGTVMKDFFRSRRSEGSSGVINSMIMSD